MLSVTFDKFLIFTSPFPPKSIVQFISSLLYFSFISNLNLLEYIAEKYPKYDFVFSDNADIINDLNGDMINTLLSFEKFIKIKISFRLAKDFDLLKEIKER